MKQIHLILSFLFAYFTFLISPIQAATIIVNAGQSIQAAINSVTTSATILVSAGTYTENLLIVNKDIILKSIDGAAHTIIDGNYNGSVITVSGGGTNTPQIQGFTLINGNGSLRNVLIPNNPIHQMVKVGGGILCEGNATPIFSQLIIENDSAQVGGGMFINNRAVPIIQNVIIQHNYAFQYGGGIWIDSIANIGVSQIKINNTLIHHNYSGIECGGIGAYRNSEAIIFNSNIVDNHCITKKGAALWRASGSIIQLNNSIIWGNDSTHFIYNHSGAGGTFSVNNCNLQYNTILTGTGSPYIPTFSDTIMKNPCFYNVTRQNYRLTANSPCVNEGNPSGAPGIDLDNRSRNISGIIDIGAYEFDPTIRDTSLVYVMDSLKILNPSKYDYVPDGLGGIYAKYRLIVTHYDTTSFSTRNNYRNQFNFVTTYKPFFNDSSRELWTINIHVNEAIKILTGVPGSSSAKPKKLDEDDIISYESFRAINSPIPPIIPNLPVTNTSQSTLIALLDAGIDFNHPDLFHAIYYDPTVSDSIGMNFIDDAMPYNTFDNNLVPVSNMWNNGEIKGGHGSFLAALIANIAQLNILNNNIKILSVKVLDNNGIGTSFSIANGIAYATSKGVKAINLSLGATGIPDAFMFEALEMPYLANIPVIVAAGNEAQNNDSTLVATFPATFNYPNIISVQAIDSLHNLWKARNREGNMDTQVGSNYANHENRCIRSVDFATYGSSVESSLPTYHHINANVTNNLYLKGKKSGTSVSAAITTAMVINELKINTSIGEIKNNLMRLAALNNIGTELSATDGALLMNQQTNWYLWNDNESTTKEYVALNHITAPDTLPTMQNGFYIVNNNANVKLKAGKSITLKAGFKTNSGTFQAQIIPIQDLNCPIETPLFPKRYASPVWVRHQPQMLEAITKVETETIVTNQCRIYPNPFVGETHIELQLAKKATVSVEVYNQVGAKVALLWNEIEKEEGQHLLTWSPENETAGVYFVKIYLDKDTVITEKLILLNY